jgi:hypothetical protein
MGLGVHSMSKVPFSKLDVATLRCSFGALPARRGDSGDREGYNRDVVQRYKHFNNPSVKYA